MQFVRINDQEVNVGLIKLITFGPTYVPDPNDPLVQEWASGKIVEWNDMKKIALPRAWVTIEGRQDRIEVSDPERIGVLKTLWGDRTVL